MFYAQMNKIIIPCFSDPVISPLLASRAANAAGSGILEF